MAAATGTGTVSKLLFPNLSKSFPFLLENITNKLPALQHHYSTNNHNNGPSTIHPDGMNEASEDLLLQNLNSAYDQTNSHRCPPDPIPNRPLRGEKRTDPSRFVSHQSIIDTTKQLYRLPRTQFRRGGGGASREEEPPSDDDFMIGMKTNYDGSIDHEQKTKLSYKNPNPPSPSPFTGGPNRTVREERIDDQSVDDFLEKFKLRNEKQETTRPEDIPSKIPETEVETSAADSPPPEADEIFKKMKETGLIPNAVAMLDGLCKDGLVQEAMKLFGLMREKGAIPEVVIYTAVVEGFCKAHKFDDAKRIFRKMLNNGISPNAFSYTVLIEGLCKGKKLEDAVEFCVEMLDAGHSPNVVTFAALVDSFCKEKGVEEAGNVIGKLREKGFFVNEKTVREHLDKKGPFSPLVWEAVFGKKPSQRLF